MRGNVLRSVVCVICLSALGFSVSSSANTFYYQMDLAEDAKSILVGMELISECFASYQDIYGDMLPARHEAIVLRAIYDVCGEDEYCWLFNDYIWMESDILPWDVGEIQNCYLTSDYIDDMGIHDWNAIDANCNTIGRKGLSDLPFESLFAGSRWNDLKGMTAVAANNEKWEEHHGNPKGQANQSPYGHSYLTGQYIKRAIDAPDDPHDPLDWITFAGDNPAGIVEREQYALTTTAAFLVDRFLQAEDAVADADPYTIANYYSAVQEMEYFWRFPCGYLSILTEAAGVEECLSLVLPPAIATCEFEMATCITSWNLALWEFGYDDFQNAYNSMITADTACTATGLANIALWSNTCLAYMTTDDDSDDDREGERLKIHQRPFFVGQGAHTIADSFAHTIRDYKDDTGARLIGQVRRSGAGDNWSDDEIPWQMAHSNCYDAECMFGYEMADYGVEKPPWEYKKYIDKPFSPDLDFPVFNQLGEYNLENSAQAVAEWIQIWNPENDTFDKRYQALEEFIKAYFSLEIVQEIFYPDSYPDGGGAFAPYNRWDRLCTDESSSSDEPDYSDNCLDVEGVSCDRVTGICRKECDPMDPNACFEGFRCGPFGDRNYCYQSWNPWDLVGEEYFGRTDENEEYLTWEYDHVNEEFTPDRQHEPLEARKWYKIDIWGDERRFSIPEGCEDAEVILFENRGYGGDAHCLELEDGVTSEYHTISYNVGSFYVAPGRKATFKRVYHSGGETKTEYMSIYGGLNGSAELTIQPPWSYHKGIPGSEKGNIAEVHVKIIDIDGDGIDDQADNCLLKGNPPEPCEPYDGICPAEMCMGGFCQADMDGDGIGDACDHDQDGDGVLEDEGGFWRKGDGEVLLEGTACVEALSVEWEPGMPKVFCDDNCPTVFNPAQKDLNGDGVLDQFDIDGDGIGDACDEDLDGDGTYVEYPSPETINETDDSLKEEANESLVVLQPPELECAEFVWTISEDRDFDGKCDLYNYADTRFLPELTQETEEIKLAGEGFLKQAEAGINIDTENRHYMSKDYRDNFGQGYSEEANEDVMVHFKGATDYPGEAGYSWPYALSEEGEQVFYGYEACIRNLIDVWNYYAPDVESQGAVLVVDQLGTKTAKLAYFKGDPEEFIPKEFYVQGSTGQPYEVTEEQAMRQEAFRDAFVASLDPRSCRVDNCIRFNLLAGDDDTDKEYVDPLGWYIMEKDVYPEYLTEPESADSEDSLYCFTPNLHTGVGDDDTQVHDARTICRVPTPGEEEPTAQPDEATDSYAPGYEIWFRNEDQQDSNDDGIGDKCSMHPDLVEMKQRHDWQALGWSNGSFSGSIKGKWWTEEQFENIVSSGNSFESGPDGDAVDKVNGYKVRFGALNPPDDDTPIDYMTLGEIENVCNGCSSCEVRARVMKARQKLSFKVTGFSIQPVDTTLGACSCNLPDAPECWSGNDYCTHPNDRGWDTADLAALEGYEFQATQREYNASGRPRYPGFRYAANRTEDTEWATDQAERWEGEVLAPVCQNQFLVEPLGGDLLGFKPIGKDSWDELHGTHQSPSDETPLIGCQEISMTYHAGEQKSMTWRHQGQQEPDSTTIPPEQLWFNGHKTRMRLATRVPGKETADFGLEGARDVWLRQWHSDTESTGGIGVDAPSWWTYWELSMHDTIWFEDHQRPLSDAQMGGQDGVVLIERRCEVSYEIDPGHWTDQGPDDWWTTGFSARGARPGAVTREDLEFGNNYVRGVERRVSRDGVVSRPWWSAAERPEGRFPVAGYAWVEIYSTAAVAAVRFGLENANQRYADDDVLRVDIVLGGVLPDGRPSRAVWVRRGWEEPATFRAVTEASQLAFARRPQVVVDATTGRVLAVNGAGPNGDAGVFELDPVAGSWTAVLDADGVSLATTTESTVVRDVAGERAFVLTPSASAMALSRLDLAGRSASLRELPARRDTVAPRPRINAAAAYKDGAIWLFGGRGIDQALVGDLWSFDLRSGRWTERIVANGPTPRERTSLVVLGDGGLALFGGLDAYGLVSRESAWNLDATRAGTSWERSAEESEMQLAVGMPALTFEYDPDAPTIFALEARDAAPGEEQLVQVVLSNPAGNLKVAALPYASSAAIRTGAAGPNGSLSVALHAGETWRFTVVPKDGAPAPGADRSYTIEAKAADQGAKIATVSALPLTRFDARNDTVFVAAWNKLKAFKRSGDAMVQVGAVSLPSAADVVVDGGYAYVADFFHGLKVVNVANPASPQVVASEWVLGLADSIAKIGDRVYLGTGLLGVQVVDVSDPADPEWVETIPVDDIVVDVSAANGLLMVSGLLDGVTLYSAAPGRSAVLLSTYTPQCWVDDTAYYGGWLYVKGLGDSVEVVDVRNAAAPVYVETVSGGRRGVAGRWGDTMVAVPGALSGIIVYNVQRQ